MIIFYIYITIDSIFLKKIVIFIFVVINLVQFCIILVRNSMFYKKHKSSYMVTAFYYVINTVFIYSWKNIAKILTHFDDALCTKYIFFIAHGVQLDNRVNPLGIINPHHLYCNHRLATREGVKWHSLLHGKSCALL